MSTPEGRIKAMLKKKIKLHFPKAWTFMPVQSGYGAPALDFILCIDGMFVTIETKASGKEKLTPTQESTAAAIAVAGGLVLRVHDEESCEKAIALIHVHRRFYHVDFEQD
jgi:hypothetical protein